MHDVLLEVTEPLKGHVKYIHILLRSLEILSGPICDQRIGQQSFHQKFRCIPGVYRYAITRALPFCVIQRCLESQCKQFTLCICLHKLCALVGRSS